MPQRHLRTRTKRRLNVATPHRKGQIHYERENPPTAPCALCGRHLAGIQRSNISETRKLSRNKKTVWRPYGGQICPSCLKKGLKQTARNL